MAPSPNALNALRDLKVIDVTTMIAGPTAGRLFAELGADVVHVEPPHGDDGRNSTTPFLGSEGLIHSVANRSKRGVAIDLRQECGREVLISLVRQADIFIENMTTGAADRLGIGYAKLSEANPGLIYLSISGWGSAGPLAPLGGYDILIQAFVGAMRRPGHDLPPMFVPIIGDATAPIIGAFVAMAALREREKTGRGSHVSTSLLQAALHTLGTTVVEPQNDPTPRAQRPPTVRPGGTGVFQTADNEHIVIASWTDEHFRRLCRLADVEHLAQDPELQTRLGRQRAHVELNEVFGAWVASQSQADIIRRLQEERVPCAPVNREPADLLTDPHLLENEMVVTIYHPEKGPIRQFAPAFEVDGRRPEVSAAPSLGQHTDEVLLEHGYSVEAIESLRKLGGIR